MKAHPVPSPLLLRNRNYRLLFTAGGLTNLGDGMVALALPWLASLMTRDPFAIALVAAAGRLPWLIFSIPAGVVVDRTDRRKLMVRADLMRAAIMVAILILALRPPGAEGLWLLTGLAFLLGSVEVLRDNCAQTLLPSLVADADLEAANGQMWSVEHLTGQFIGPPLAGVLIAIGIGLPFGIHASALVLAAGLVWLIVLEPHQPAASGFVQAMVEGIRFLRHDSVLLRLAIMLGVANFLAMATLTVQILLAQDVLGLTAAEYGIVLSVEAMGAILGGLLAPVLIRRMGLNRCLSLAVAVWALGSAVVAVSGNAVVVATALALIMAAAMLWNVITVSWRQRRIPSEILGRVNSIYRCFGWGSMPLGALAGGLVVSLLENDLGRELALRAPFLLASVAYAALLIYAAFRLRLE